MADTTSVLRYFGLNIDHTSLKIGRDTELINFDIEKILNDRTVYIRVYQ